MKIEQFFGRCIGQKVKVLKPLYKEQKKNIYTLMGVNCRNGGFCELFFEGHIPEYPTKHCQIIGRRISQMTDEEKQMLRSFSEDVKKESELQPFLLWNLNLTNYLFDIGVFPDKYFDELKWCVEA